MSDDATPKPKTIELPMTSFVKGGTLTAAYERQLAAQKHDAEKRRDAEAERHRIVRANPSQAHMNTMRLGGTSKHAAIVLHLKHPKDNTVLDSVVCELIVQEDGTFVLNMACPKCAQRGIGDNFKFVQKNRPFELDTRRQGELWVNPRDPNEIVTLAGTIHMTERAKCPNLGCDFAFRIDDSVLKPV